MTNDKGWTSIMPTSSATAEDIATALNNAGITNIPNPETATPEIIALALGGPSFALFHVMTGKMKK